MPSTNIDNELTTASVLTAVGTTKAKPIAELTGKKQHGRPRGKPFVKGRSGNPAGRPKGRAQTIASMLQRAGGVSPLEFLLALSNDETASIADRLEAAKISLPFLHRRLPDADELNCQALSAPLTEEPSRVQYAHELALASFVSKV